MAGIHENGHRNGRSDCGRLKMRSWIVFAALFLVSCAGAVNEDGDPSSEPGTNCAYQPCFKGGSVQGEKNFSTLINSYLSGKPEPTPWAGYWFPYTENGIAAGKTGTSPAG